MWAEAFKTCTKRVCVRIAGPAEMALKYPANKDPFLEDNDDDFSFASQGRSSRSQQSKGQNYSPWEEPQDEYSRPKSQAELFQEQKQLAMNRQLDSTQRIMGSIYDSERVGIATAEVKLEKYTCEIRGRLLSVCVWVRCMCVNKGKSVRVASQADKKDSQGQGRKLGRCFCLANLPFVTMTHSHRHGVNSYY